uniref:Uncharacterized protein n=1 Tax=Sphaerodactylus townsendi TaxID=933632 RepID=A0ACB8FMK8_9SAUR
MKMGWPTETKALLIVLVFSKWPLTTYALLQESSLAGTPLSDDEYKYFFQDLTAPRVIHTVCFRRAVFGCHHPAIEALDRYENHGIIPEGKANHTSQTGKCVMGEEGGRIVWHLGPI